MKDQADDRTGELTLTVDQIRSFVGRARDLQHHIEMSFGVARTAEQRVDLLARGEALQQDINEAIADAKRRPVRAKRGVSKNAAKSAAKPERGEK